LERLQHYDTSDKCSNSNMSVWSWADI